MNIVFAADNSYAEHVAVAMCSLFENNRHLSFNVYVVNANIAPSTWRKLEQITERYGHVLIDIKICDEELDHLVTNHHFTKANYYRLFIPEKLQVDKVLYLDADVVVDGPIDDLYNSDVESHYLAAVVNPSFDRHESLEMSPASKYFNSGIMLINLVAWRREDIKGKVIEFVKRKPDAIQYVDQCGLNAVVNGLWQELHPKYNLQGCVFEAEPGMFSDTYAEFDLDAALKHPVIIHYSGTLKPWHLRYKHPWKKVYWKYLRMTPFSHVLSNDFTLLNAVKLCIPNSLKNFLKKQEIPTQ